MTWLDILSKIINWIIPAILGGVVSGLTVYIRQTKKKDKAIHNGVKCLLRGELIRYHKEYLTQGYCTINNRRVFDEMYDAYHDLGGNDVVTQLKEEVERLPTLPKA